MRIQDVVNEVPLLLTFNRVYILQALLSDNSTYRFGYFVSAVDPTPTLNIRRIAFSRQAQLSYRYVTVEATRPNATHIQLNYLDTLAQTTFLDFTIRLRNGTFVYNDNSTLDSVQFNWLSADNETDYIAYLDITHGFFGTLQYSEPLTGGISVMAVPTLEVVGTWGGMSASSVLPAAIIFVVAGAFSLLSAPVGLFAVVVTAGVLTYLGWCSIPYTILATAMGLAVIFGIAHRRSS